MITAECINCTACALDCPVEAITPGPNQYIINPGICVDCEGLYSSPRCAFVCPVGACVPKRASYEVRIETMAARGAHPVRYAMDAPIGQYVIGGWAEETPELVFQSVGGDGE
jgi:Fe-S-cluster-containing hydrogenase component 2